jgi:predicted O-methyltransferase YrrM
MGVRDDEQKADCSFHNLRLVRSNLLAEYLVNTAYWKRVGNDAFAQAILDNALPRSISALISEESGTPWVLYHSWLPGLVNLAEAEAEFVRERIAMSDPPSDISGNAQHAELLRGLMARGWCSDAQVDIDRLVARRLFVAVQNDWELKGFLKLVQEQRPRVVLEIGTARGGVLCCFSQLADRDALIISIDLPGARNCGGQTEHERLLFSTFGPASQRFEFLPADSHDAATKERLAELLAGRTLDLLFIDGDHSYEGVRCDFEMYRGFMSNDGILAIHDIQVFPENCEDRAAVGVFWQELKKQYATREIIDPHGSIPKLARQGSKLELVEDQLVPAWGIGIVDPPR